MAQPPYGPYEPDPYAQHYQQPPPVASHHYYLPRTTNGMATMSLIMGLVGLLFCGLTAPLAIIFGHMAHSQIKRTGEEGSGMAIAGIVTGWVVVALWALVLLFWFGLLAAIGIGGAAATSSGY